MPTPEMPPKLFAGRTRNLPKKPFRGNLRSACHSASTAQEAVGDAEPRRVLSELLGGLTIAKPYAHQRANSRACRHVAEKPIETDPDVTGPGGAGKSSSF